MVRAVLVVFIATMTCCLNANSVGAQTTASALAVCLTVDGSSSNLQPSDGYRASDPGPTYIRTELLRLMADLLSTDSSRPVLLAFTVFDGNVRASQELIDAGDDRSRADFILRFDTALRGGGWTNVRAGVEGCARLLDDSVPSSGGKTTGCVALIG